MRPLADINDPRLVKALAHPIRVRILGILESTTTSPNDLSQRLGLPLGNVSYHVRRLHDLGLIELVRKVPRRGAIEHFYKATARPRVTDKAWAGAPEIVKQALIGATLEQLGALANTAASTGGFSREGAYLGRFPIVVDEEGWDEASALLAKLVEDLERVQRDAEKRLRKADHEGEQRATLGLLLFDTPEPVQAPEPSRTAVRRRSRSRATA